MPSPKLTEMVPIAPLANTATGATLGAHRSDFVCRGANAPHPSNLHTYWDNSLVELAMAGRTERDFVGELSQFSVSGGGDANGWVKE